MPSKSSIFVLIVTGLTIAAIVLSAIAWARVNELSLPLPLPLPVLNVLVPILTAVAWPLSRRLSTAVKKHALKLALPYLAYGSTLAPFILFILSLMYAVPSDMQACAADRHWLRMFDHKNEQSVRSIQSRLQCCGYNSMHDRAWPFPSRNVDARTCERTMGYTVACGEMWRNHEVFAAVLTAVASFLNWLMMILIVENFPQNEGQIRLPTWSSHPTRLIGAGPEHAEQEEHHDDSARDDSEHTRIWNNEAENAA